MLANLDAVLTRWREPGGPSLRPPADERALHRWGVEAAQQPCWELWRSVDGFGAPVDQDRDGFCFWSTERMVLVSDYEGGRHVPDGLPSMVLFADYLGWSWAYAVVVGGGAANVGSVYLVGAEDGAPQRVADSFDEFLALYLADSERLYPR